jgi:DNA repair exonuclease SbcCD nuclease subunit
MVSFLHAADLHLGLRITRFRAEIASKIREARFQALERIRQAAKDHAVNFVLIAGDLFDDHAVDGGLASRAFDVLESFPVPVYVLSGNHDPLLPGAVWDRAPWNQAEPKKVRVLRETKPEPVGDGVLILPCPVFRKTSLNDPTTWIGQLPTDRTAIRIGVAHGSLKIREELPADDHLIAPTAAHNFQLDYLALGHWHSRQFFKGPDGAERTAYCGVHEPMRFPGMSESRTGWVAYSSRQLREFLDTGKGEILHVRIERPGAHPVIQPLEVGHLSWDEKTYPVQDAADLGAHINEIATRPTSERCLLRLKLTGILDGEAMLRLEQLREVLDRYLWGELDTSDLHLSPTAEEIQEIAGQGVLRRVLEKLQHEAASEETETRQVAEQAILLLYQVAKEVGA